MIALLAMLWALMLLGVALGAYAFGWWWRGQYEAERRAELERRLERYEQEPIERGVPLRVVK